MNRQKSFDPFSTFVRYLWGINVGCFRNFSVFGYGKCQKRNRNFWFSPRLCLMIGVTNLQRLMCNWLCVVELLCHTRWKRALCSIRPVWNDWFLIQHVCFYLSSTYALWREIYWLSLETTSLLLTSQVIQQDFKSLWRHMSVVNVGIVLKLSRLSYLIVVIICTNICKFS